MINLEEYKKIKELLLASNEDFEVGCENIKNLNTSPIEEMLFAKTLTFHRRYAFCEKFKIKEESIKEWNELFKSFNVLTTSKSEKELIEHEIHQQLVPIIKNSYEFTKEIKFKLDWV